MNALVIIDMQVDFDVEKEPDAIAGVKQQIIQAKNKNIPIIVVEYDGMGETHPELTDLMTDYNNVFYTKKPDRDGSEQIIEILKAQKLKPQTLQLCGLFADCCVLATAKGLLKRTKKMKIQVIKKATDQFARKSVTWKKFYPTRQRLQLV